MITLDLNANYSLLYIQRLNSHVIYESERKHRQDIYRLNPNYDLGTLCLNVCK